MTTPPLERFAREYQEYHGLSEGRRRTQQKCLRQLEERAGKDLLACNADDIREFLSSELDRGLHVNTIRKHLGMIKPFYGWAYEAKLIDSDTLMQITRISPPRGATNSNLPKPYSTKELRKFREELADEWPTVEDKWWTRWRRGTSRFRRVRTHAMRIQLEAITALALHCGLRCQEIYKASIEDIHYDNAYVVVRFAKDHANGKFREVPHTEVSREAVRQWLELREEFKPGHDLVWLSLAHEGIASEAMRWDRFRKFMGTIGSGWELHRFRHTYGTEMLRATGRLEIVQRLLGHSRIQQTLGYAEIMRDDLHDEVAKADAAFTSRVNGEEAVPA